MEGRRARLVPAATLGSGRFRFLVIVVAVVVAGGDGSIAAIRVIKSAALEGILDSAALGWLNDQQARDELFGCYSR